jgi:hypothetical protein
MTSRVLSIRGTPRGSPGHHADPAQPRGVWERSPTSRKRRVLRASDGQRVAPRTRGTGRNQPTRPRLDSRAGVASVEARRRWPSDITFPGSPACRPSDPVPQSPNAPSLAPPHLRKTFPSPLNSNSAESTVAANRSVPSNKVPAVERAPLGVRKVMS